jgi:hypothetical protein
LQVTESFLAFLWFFPQFLPFPLQTRAVFEEIVIKIAERRGEVRLVFPEKSLLFT